MSRWRFAILRAASYLVPAARRQEWRAEWRAELNYVERHRVDAATAFCLGALRDAFWLRRHEPRPTGSWDSAAACLVTLAVVAGAAALLGNLLTLPRLPLLAMPFEIAFALLMLPAVTTFSTGECPPGMRARYWNFFVLKAALTIAAAWFVTLDVAALIARQLQVHGLMVCFVVAFRWVLADQRRRCPVCLRRVVCPARIGASSYLLLEWYGTEFVCSRGHGLLQVPEISSSAYGAPRWQPLDASWSGLFERVSANRES